MNIHGRRFYSSSFFLRLIRSTINLPSQISVGTWGMDSYSMKLLSLFAFYAQRRLRCSPSMSRFAILFHIQSNENSEDFMSERNIPSFSGIIRSSRTCCNSPCGRRAGRISFRSKQRFPRRASARDIWHNFGGPMSPPPDSSRRRRKCAFGDG